MSVSDLPAGDYLIYAHLDEDEKYLPSDNDTNMCIFKINPNLDVEVSHEGNVSIFVVELPDDATGNVTFDINGTKYTVPVIDGKTTLMLYNLSSGNYDVNATYFGDSKYEGNEGNADLKINDTSKKPSKDIIVGYKEYNKGIDISKHETGNPIVIALIVLLSIILIPFGRRK